MQVMGAYNILLQFPLSLFISFSIASFPTFNPGKKKDDKQ